MVILFLTMSPNDIHRSVDPLTPTASRRRLLQVGATVGIVGAGPIRTVAAHDHSSSDDLEKYVQSLPIPEERVPDGKHGGATYHEIQIEEAQHSFHPDLSDTTIWGYDGQFPGPIISARRGQRLAVRFDNSQLPDEHLFEVDERIPGTTSENYVGYDGPVPAVRTSTHFHGLNIAPESDGQSDMWTSPDGVEGPRFSTAIQEVPNRQPRLTAAYHDHARSIARLNLYAGLVGPYYIRSKREQQLNLPAGDYDIPLLLADRTFTEDGELHYPDQFVPDFGGDTATVNGAAWPYLEVEPRRYRLRLINGSNGRTFDLELVNEEGDRTHHNDGHDTVPTLYQFSPGHGYLEEMVSIGPGGELSSLLLTTLERADIVVDFSDHAGETFTLVNHAEFPFAGGMDHDGMGMEADQDDMEFPQLHEIMQIRVGKKREGTDTSADPADLTLPQMPGINPKAARTTREITMEMEEDDYGLTVHTLNERRWGDPIEIKPQLGTTEIWELVNNDHHTHPIHPHLVAFEVLDREQHGDHNEGDHDGHGADDHADDHNEDHDSFGPLPNERGEKDTVRVDPGETVRIAVQFKRFAGEFPVHCHILEHEDHDMMRSFEVITGDG